MGTDLLGKTALVTGAAKRLGRIIALKLASEGVNVVFNYRKSAEEAEDTRRDLEQLGVRALAIQADLTELPSCRRLIEDSLQFGGGVDILINNASDFLRTPLNRYKEHDEAFFRGFEYQTGLHMRAPLYLGLELGLRMKKNGWGRIINITDRVIAKGQAYRHYILYLATKYGLYGISQALAEELAPEVTVNTVAPGLTLPPPDYSEETIQQITQEIPLRRSADPQEIAADILHLIRSDSKTGSTILTDGGAGLHTY